jgi:hypothetical protein
MVISLAALAPLVASWPLQSFKLMKFVSHQVFSIEMASYARKVSLGMKLLVHFWMIFLFSVFSFVARAGIVLCQCTLSAS